MKTIRNLILGLLLGALSAFGQLTYVGPITGETPLTVLTSGYQILSITFTPDGTNSYLKAYDSSSGTNIVIGSYSRPLSYSTNISVVWTNESDVPLTNTFSGVFTTTETVAASTNERPKFLTTYVPADTQRTRNLNYIATQGLILLSDVNGVVEVTYSRLD